MHGRGHPIKVLHLRDSAWVDGPGRTILESGSHFDRARIDYHIGVLVPDELAPHPMVEGARQRGLQVHRIVDRGGLDRRVRQQILQLVEQLDIDILHSSDIRTNLFCFLCGLRPRVRRVTTAHGWIANTLRRRMLRLVDKAVLRSFDAVIFVSAATRSLLPRWWLSEARAHVVPNALALDAYTPAAADAGAVNEDSTVTIVNVGRLSPEKGQELLLDAFASLLPAYPQLRLQFAGAGPLEARLRAQASRLGVGQHVRFLGFIADMPAVYACSDLVVQSSLTEGMPNVVLEAALLRVPIVATAVGGTAEIVDHGRSGWLIEAGSRAALKDGIRHFMEHRRMFGEMAESAHEHVKTHHSFAARTHQITEIYERLLGSSRCAG